MKRRGHLGITLLGCAPIVFVFLAIDAQLWVFAVLGTALTMAASGLPDRDMQWRSMFIVGQFIQHRGITHTVWFGMAVGIVFVILAAGAGIGYVITQGSQAITGSTVLAAGTTVVTAVSVPIAVGIWFTGVYGVVLHLLGDVITPTGIKPFYPVRNTKCKRVLWLFGQRSVYDSALWNWLFFLLGCGLFALAAIGGIAVSDAELTTLLNPVL